MKKTFVATAVALAFWSPAWASDVNLEVGDITAALGRSAALNDSNLNTITWKRDTTNVSARQTLSGSVEGNEYRQGNRANGEEGEAGKYGASNNLAENAFKHSTGVNMVSQNTGAGALIQQGVNAQVNMKF
jgi:hypothetical protein